MVFVTIFSQKLIGTDGLLRCWLGRWDTNWKATMVTAHSTTQPFNTATRNSSHYHKLECPPCTSIQDITRRSHFRFTIRLILAWIKLLLMMMTNKQNTFSWLCICFIQYSCYRLYCVIGFFHEEEKGVVLMNICSSERPLLLLSNVCFLKISLLLLVLCLKSNLERDVVLWTDVWYLWDTIDLP